MFYYISAEIRQKGKANGFESMSLTRLTTTMVCSILFWYLLCIFSDWLTNFRKGSDVNPSNYQHLQDYRKIQKYDQDSVENESKIVDQLFKELKK